MGRILRPLREPITRHKTEGQSIPLIALMIVILVAIVGLAVDVGNTYAEQRELVAATNAAAIVGMQTHLSGNATVGEVRQSIEESLEANGISLTDGSYDERDFSAVFLKADGSELSDIPPNPGGDPANNTDLPPQGVAYIQVNTSGDVDTFFARLVNTDDLPVDHLAYAGICPPNSGVYPITVDADLFTNDGDAFIEPDGVQDPQNPEWGIIPQQRDNPWSGKTWRRVYLKDAGVGGGLGLLRWSEASDPNGFLGNSEDAFRASLEGDGNLALNFEEVVPPPGLAVIPDNPESYPMQPNQINAGDWIWQGPDQIVSANAISALQTHLDRGTVMTLPVYDYTTEVAADGGGTEGVFRVARLGTFVIQDFVLGGQGSEAYMDLIYLNEDVTAMACTVTAVEPALLGLTGKVSFWPEYKTNAEERLPVQYFVVLDASGSMNFSFEGWGWDPKKDDRKACAVELDGVVIDGKTYTASGCAGSGDGWSNGNAYHGWHPVKERRVYVAKKALDRLVDLVNMPGTDGEDTSRPSDKMQIVWFSDRQKAGWKSNLSSDPDYIRQSILRAGVHPGGISVDQDVTAPNFKKSNIPSYAKKPINGGVDDGLIEIYYTSNGGTNGAAGLYRASELLGKAPSTVTDANGKTWEYKRAVIVVTDGVSNQIFSEHNLNDSDLRKTNNRSASNFHPDNFCHHLPDDTSRHNNATCQTTSGASGGERDTLKGKRKIDGKLYDRPITQMGNVSETYLKPNAEVYVIALSDFATVGLKERVASFPEYFVPARELKYYEDGSTNVDKIIEFINRNVGEGECIANAENRWVGDMSQGEADGRNFNWPEVGFVELFQNGNKIDEAPIVAANGELRYTFNNNLPQGSYELRATLVYAHPVDQIPRVYSDIFGVDETVSPSVSVIIAPRAEIGGSMIEFDLQLKLPDDDFVCPKLEIQ